MKSTFILLATVVFFSMSFVFAQVSVSSAEEAVQIALRNSDEYRYVKQATLENMQAAHLSFREFLPAIGVGFSESDTIHKNALDSRSKSIHFSVGQKLYDGGKTRLLYELGRINSYYAYQEYEQKERNFASEVLTHYYAYIKQRERTLIQKELVENARTQLRISQTESTLGLSLQTDYLEYAISFLQIEYEYAQSERDLEKHLRKLKTILGLEQEVVLTVNGLIEHTFEHIQLGQYEQKLWYLIRAKNIELKKQDTAINAAVKQHNVAHSYVPTVVLEGGVSFTGATYPLTMPSYELKLVLHFDNNKLFPLSVSNGYGFTNDGLHSLENAVQMQVLPSSTFFVEKRINELSILQSRLQRANTETALQEALRDTLYSYEDCVFNIQLTKESIELAQLRLEFRKIELESGEIKAIDFLNDLLEIAQQKTTLIDLLVTAVLLERSLEVSAHIPFGELRYVCSE